MSDETNGAAQPIGVTPRGVTRRGALAATAGLSALAAGCGRPESPAPPAPTGLFRHGVASGDPLADRVVIWTRVTVGAEEPAEVRWVVARDEGLSDIVRAGTEIADPANDFCVKIDVDGLVSGAAYYYAFESGAERSPVGRMTTLPEGAVERFRIAAVSCANYPAGYFNVYNDLAARGADLVVHLGDYLYEYGPGEYATERADELGRTLDPPKEIVTLDDYRRRHALYKSDPDLRAAHAMCPWVCVWDDHEVCNDSWKGGADNHQPDTEGDWPARKAAALRAYFEWMPVREPAPGRAAEAMWRAYEIGDLATLVMLETRLTGRDKQVTYEDDFPIDVDADETDPAVRAEVARFLDEIVGDPGREMMGLNQQAFVRKTLVNSRRAGKPWQVLGNQVMLAQVTAPDYTKTLPGWFRWAVSRKDPRAADFIRRTRFGVPLTLDSWDGYPAARETLYRACRDAHANIVTLTGDTHNFWTNVLTDAAGVRCGVEFGASSVSSPSDFDAAKAPTIHFGPLTEAANADVLFHDPHSRGYVLLELTPEAATADYVKVDTVFSRAFEASVIKRYVTRPTDEGGTTGVEEVEVG